MLINGDARRIPLADKSVHCAICSPPYWNLRDYGTATWEGGDAECEHKAVNRAGTNAAVRSTLSGENDFYADTCPKCGARRIDAQLGLEESPEEFVANLVAVGREVWRVLHPSGVWWLNLGSSYAGSGKGGNPEGSQWAGFVGNKDRERSAMASGPMIPASYKTKDLVDIPHLVSEALRRDGWWLRSAAPWLKRNPMPESCTDRPTTAHETVFLLTKSERYYYDADAVRVENTNGTIKRLQSGAVQAIGDGHKRKLLGDNQGGPEYVNPAGRNRRTTDWWYESLDILIAQEEAYTRHLRDVRDTGGLLCDEEGMPLGFMVNTQAYSGQHYATFPEALVRPMILAGTSERGCCPECRNPWERVVGRGLTAHDGNTQSAYQEGTAANRLALLRQAARERGEEYVGGNITTGWRPTCAHYDGGYLTFPRARNPRKRHQRNISGDWWERVRKRPGRDEWDTVPCIVLDPFAGSGTVNLVCQQLGRQGIGIDLSLDYLQMARKRTGAKALDDWERGQVVVEETDMAGLPLWEG